MKASAFFNSLKAGELLPLYVFCGSEAYLRQEALRRLRAKLLPEGLEALNENVLTNPGLLEFNESIQTLPLMCDRRLVLVRDWVLLGGGEKKDAGKEKRPGGDAEGETGEFLSLLKRLPETVCLVIDCGESLDKRRKLGKALAAEPGFVSLDPLEDGELFSFLTRRARKLGVDLTRPACDSLIARAGRDLTALTGEMEKLAAYAGPGGTIGPESVEALVAPSAETRVFDMIDAAVEGRLQEAFRQMNLLVQAGETRLGILALITRQMRQMLYTRDLLDMGNGKMQIAQALGMPPFATGKQIARVQRRTVAELTAMLERCTEAEYAVKSGQLREDAALDMLLLRIAPGRV